MNLKVEVRDFQSIQKGEFEFENGVNILNGKTNSGKSAVLRAIDSALFNMGDDSMVRVGKRYAAVLIDNGTHKMIFRRDSVGKNEKTAYSFDGGNTVTKVGRTQLPEVSEMFGIRDVRMQNGTKMKLNFWYQNDKPFLTDKTAGQLYEFLSLSSCDKYSKILKTMGADIKIMNAEVANRGIEIDTLKVMTAKKEEFVKKNEGYRELYEKIVVFGRECKENESLREIINRIINYMKKVKSLEKTLMSVKDWESDPILKTADDDMRNVRDDVNKLENIKRAINDAVRRYKEASDSEERLRSCVKAISEGRGIDGEKLINEAYDVLTGNSIVQKCVSLRDKVYDMERALIRYNSCKVPEGYEAVSQLSENLRVRDLISNLEEKRGLLYCRIKEKITLEKKDAENREELEKLKLEAGFCPYCNSVFEGGCKNEH